MRGVVRGLVARVGADWWVVIGLAVVVGGWVGWLDEQVGEIPGIWPWGWLLLGVEVLLVRWRRRWPVWVLAGVGLTGLLYWLGGYPLGPHLLPQAVALYTVAATGRRWVALGVAGAGLALLGLAYLAPRPPQPALMFSAAAWLALVVGAGELSRARRERLAQVEAYAAELERGREQEARRRVAEERLRLSRELHDVVSHHIGVIHVQSGAALLRMDRHPDLAGTALTAIHQASSTAMTELRTTLGLLRTPQNDSDRESDSDPESDSDGVLAPVPTLDRLAELVDRAEATGLTVTVVGDREVGAVPAVVAHAAYRIVQESLTNVTRHAGATEARIDLAREGDHLVVMITDHGRPGREVTDPSDSPGSGLGLRGMRERAAALGGEVTAGPGEQGGFVVRAVLPVPPPPAAPAAPDVPLAGEGRA